MIREKPSRPTTSIISSQSAESMQASQPLRRVSRTRPARPSCKSRGSGIPADAFRGRPESPGYFREAHTRLRHSITASGLPFGSNRLIASGPRAPDLSRQQSRSPQGP